MLLKNIYFSKIIFSTRLQQQAFRIYASIYSKAHPSRSPEIFQYIHVISTAATCFVWDNVVEYDYTFRQLMSNYPHRSWAKIYTQVWNLALKDPINRGSAKGSRMGQGHSSNNTGGRAAGREKYCWKFNKNRCPDTAATCNGEHCCKYCDAWGHSFYNCYKKLNRSEWGKKKAAPGGGNGSNPSANGEANNNHNQSSHNVATNK